MDPQTVLFSVFGPFLVWPLEYLFPYPFIVEEIFKAIVVWFGPKNIKAYIVAGILFALSETILYVFNINASGNTQLMLIRFVTTSLLHSGTFALIYLSSRSNKKLIFLGLTASILIHYLYNIYI
jgi:hypothetical protein